MKTFDKVKFLGTFRNYQQRVLDNSKKYLENKKIHIVAAPGSGKTILGLELIRRLNSPCIVLSPTNTIRYQWGDRFEGMYLPKGEKIEDYVSFDLNNVRPITSITYQGLHSAINKIACTDEDDQTVDYSNIDLFKLINDYGIKTICVDEAHHLQNEWQKALEFFMKGLDKNISVVALTATPPYDASETEWKRYISICGDIDEEIFVTELVNAKNLCPHQDYIYFNYPTKEEGKIFTEYKNNVCIAFEELKNLEFFKLISKRVFELYKQDQTIICNNIFVYSNIFSLLKKLEIPFDENTAKKYLAVENWELELANYESALNLLLSSTNILLDSEKAELQQKLKSFGLIERNAVCLNNNTKLDKKLIVSLGKLESISKITAFEHNNLKNKLRLLVLTDYIRKTTLNKVGTKSSFDEISTVSIFETIRRTNPEIKLGLLSGGLVVLPTQLKEKTKLLLKDKISKLTLKEIPNTNYSEFIFNLSNKEKVAVVGKLFEDGDITTLVGTKSLLGEGWDSPCINTLIMASFVGSFMLSNQMRGRAIRVFKGDPNKTANIWHLVTLEPENLEVNTKLDCNEESSTDYKTLKRRFGCFVGPHYENKKIESGIDRVSILKNSYTKECVEDINNQMESLSKNREALFDKWQIKSDKMVLQSSIPFDRVPKKLAKKHLFTSTLSYAILIALFTFFALYSTYKIVTYALIGLIAFCSVKLLISFYQFLNLIIGKRFVKNISKNIKKVLENYYLIEQNGKLLITKNKAENCFDLSINLENLKEQKIFHDAVAEFFNPINDPRYLLVCCSFTKLKMPKFSFQVPSILHSKKELAEGFKRYLKTLPNTSLVYCKNEKSKKLLLACQKHNYIKNSKILVCQKQVSEK